VDTILKKTKTKSNNDAEFYANEWIKCKTNIFYFIYTYCFLTETTGELLKVTPKLLHTKMKITIRALLKLERVVLMASRQLGKSSIAALILSWALVFFPNTKVIILNMKKEAAFGNLDKIRDVINALPKWMVPDKVFDSKSEIKTYLTLFNKSKVNVFYPSTTQKANTLARSLTAPILYIDEGSFIGTGQSTMTDIYGSAQSTLSKAREQARKLNRPTFTLITSTPNGTVGVGEWFYKRYQNSLPSDLLFDQTTGLWLDNIDSKSIVNDSNSNKYVSIKYHWSEDPTKNKDWYDDQVSEIDDIRTVNQELDLIFVGSTNCIFSDEMLSSFKSQKPINNYITPNLARLDIFVNIFDFNDFYLIGCDTAESLVGNYCTIEIYSFKDFYQVAELQFKYGSYTKFGQDIDWTFRWLSDQIGGKMENIILCNENNSIGLAPIEHLLNYVHDINYDQYIYQENKNGQFGIKTTTMTKPLMIGCFMQNINEDFEIIKSQNLINQLSSMEKTPSGTIKSTGHDDLFMASCLCALIRNRKYVEVGPLLNENDRNDIKSNYKEIQQLIKTCSPHNNNSTANKSNFPEIGYVEPTYEDLDDISLFSQISHNF